MTNERAIRRIRLGIFVLLAIGLMSTVRGQMDGTASRTPDPVGRMIFAIVPFVILTGALLWLARPRMHVLVLVIVAAFMWASTAMYTNDEMRLSYWIVPVLQISIALPVVVALAVHGWWLSRRDQATRRNQPQNDQMQLTVPAETGRRS